jgi:NAD-dependent dihydropyrimidine dehydrogenase PreA subunit
MAIERIDRELCDGCGICVNACSSDVIRMDEEGKAVIKYADECIVCLYCEEECPTRAISVSPVKTVRLLNAWG